MFLFGSLFGNKHVSFSPVVYTKTFKKQETPTTLGKTPMTQVQTIFSEADAVLLNIPPRKRIRKSPTVRKRSPSSTKKSTNGLAKEHDDRTKHARTERRSGMPEG